MFKALTGIDPRTPIFPIRKPLPFKKVIRNFTIPFGGTVTKNSNLTRKITLLFDVMLQDYHVHFARNQKRQLRISLHVGGGGTSSDPTIFRSDPSNLTLYLVGDGNTRSCYGLNIYVQKGRYITAYGDNQNPAYDLTLDVEFMVQELS